jgi:hypothetical protein
MLGRVGGGVCGSRAVLVCLRWRSAGQHVHQRATGCFRGVEERIEVITPQGCYHPPSTLARASASPRRRSLVDGR